MVVTHAITLHFTDLEMSTNRFSLKILNPDISVWSQQANENEVQGFLHTNQINHLLLFPSF